MDGRQMNRQYDFYVKICSFSQCQRIHAVAQECQDVRVFDAKGSVANAKSLLSLMSLDYSNSVCITTSTQEEYFAIRKALYLK